METREDLIYSLVLEINQGCDRFTKEDIDIILNKKQYNLAKLRKDILKETKRTLPDYLYNEKHINIELNFWLDTTNLIYK